MITKRREREIQTLARSVLTEHDAMTLPVEPILFAREKLGFEVQSFAPPKPDVSGFLMRSGDKFGIGYSTTIASVGFQNFTVSHELGHYFIDGHCDALLESGPHLSKSGFISQDRFEREADVFATEFLMPWKLIAPFLDRSNQGFPVIKSIADQCQSSIIASSIRYASVSKLPGAVIVSNNGVVEFMTASESFGYIPGVQWLRRGDPLPSSVPSALRAMEPEWIAHCSIIEEGSLLSNWFTSAPKIEVEEDIVGLGSYGRLLTVLITNWDEEDDIDDDEASDSYIERWGQGIFRGKNG